METATQTPILHLLRDLARVWTEVNEAAPSRLGRLVAEDGGLSQRLLAGEGDVRTAMLERFAEFFSNPANWPEGAVPQEAREFAHRVGVSADGVAQSPGKPGEFTPAGEAA